MKRFIEEGARTQSTLLPGTMRVVCVFTRSAPVAEVLKLSNSIAQCDRSVERCPPENPKPR